MMVTGRTKVDGLIKSDFFLTVNPVRLYRLILAPAVAVHYHVERTVYIKGERQIPQWFSINLATLFRTATAGYSLSLLKLNYFAHSHDSFLKKSLNSSSSTTHLPITFCPLR